MHICLFDPGWGGVGIHSLNLKHNLEKRGLEVTMLTPQWVAEKSIIQIPIITNIYKPTGIYELSFKFWSVFRKLKKDFDLLHFNHSLIAIGFLSYFKRFPHVICTDSTLEMALDERGTTLEAFLLLKLPLTPLEKKAL